jgi:hypothetical protein
METTCPLALAKQTTLIGSSRKLSWHAQLLYLGGVGLKKPIFIKRTTTIVLVQL